jgi:hypothetical protein
LRWVFREQSPDFGIDAHIEVITESMATGKLIAVQIKSGASYFDHEDSDGIIFRGKLEHLDYWLNHDLPVIVVLYDPRSEMAYWQKVTPAHVTRTSESWKMSVPRRQKLDATQASQLEEIASTLQRLKDEIREYKCPYCGAPLAERVGDLDHFREAFQCGYDSLDGVVKRPCPWDPQFPQMEDYELRFVPIETDPANPWFCIAFPKTDMARSLQLQAGGRTKEAAERNVRAQYAQYAKRE